MNASIFPWEAASKHSKVCMIWPAAKSSIRKRPPLVSSTSLANCWAAPWSWSSAGGQVVDIRHWIFGCAMTLGAFVKAEAAAATVSPPAVAMKRHRAERVLPSTSESEGGNGRAGWPSPWPGSSDSGAVLSIECSSAAPDRDRATLYKVGHYSPFPCRKKPVEPLDGALTLSFELALLIPPRAAGRHPRPRYPRS